MISEEASTSHSHSNKWGYILGVIIIILIVNTGFFAVAFLNLQNQLENMENNLAENDNEIKSLKNQLEVFDVVNQTGMIPWPTIYNQFKDSVVLIETNLGLGSGFVYDLNGHIITNQHVIDEADSIQVTFLDGNITSADLVGMDIYSDLAVIKVDPQITTLFPVVLGKSSDLSVGEPVAAMGNPFGLSDTLTVGIVSSLERTLTAEGNYAIIDIIQLDAAINPGNSGGPLVNLSGQVVGINSAIQSETGTFTGIGFAIPSDTIKREIDDLIETGGYKHPWLGISALGMNIPLAEAIGLDKPQGILVTDVISGSPADLAGLEGSNETQIIEGVEYPIGGDVIIEIDEIPVITMDDLVVYMERNTVPGHTVTLTIIREGQEQSLDVTLGERPLP